LAGRAFPGWLREPNGEATLDDPSPCYQHLGRLTGKPEVKCRYQAFAQLCAFASPFSGSMSDMGIFRQL
jgi:hypothetical protein